MFGWKSCGYFLTQLSPPSLEQSIFINAFFDTFAEDAATTLKRALPSFDSVDQDDLLDVLQIHNSKILP